MASSLHPSAGKLRVTILASEWGSSKGGLSTINRELAKQLAKFPEVEITFKKIWNKDRDTRLQEAEMLRSFYGKKHSWDKQSQDLVAKMISITKDSESSSQTKKGLPVSSTAQDTSHTMPGEQHADKASVSDAAFINHWGKIREILVRLGGGGYGDAVDEMKNQNIDPLTEEHYKELLKQWKRNEDYIKDKMIELESVMETSGNEDISSCPSHVIERIRQLYTTREERLLPVPWCEDFSFHLNDIFTRLRIVNKDKTRGKLTEDITNMTAIFKAHEGCQKPRTILIEGDPGMGKTTYCQKLAYGWANRQEEWDESFPEIDLLLLLRCHDIKSNIWEAISDQILPEDIDEKSKENFIKFIRENQSKVMLVFDGLDEADPSKLPMYNKLVESRELPQCYIILTSRLEAGIKFRRFFDTLWEIVGFTEEDAQTFIIKHFKNKKQLADKLIRKLFTWSRSTDLCEMTSNPLNTALLCVLFEDFKGDLPTNRTQLYIEIVLCVLRRYEKKKGFLSNNEDLIKVYEEELIQLGLMAFYALRKGELYIEESECGSNSTALIKFGFLSVQTSGSRRKPCLRYGFLHKSFQEFFAGFYHASKILRGENDLDTVMTDLGELKHAFLFMSGIVSKCEEAAVCLVKSITAHINSLSRSTLEGKDNIINSTVTFAFDCIKECITCNENLQSRLLRTFGSYLDVETFELRGCLYDSPYTEFFSEVLTVNTTLTNLCYNPELYVFDSYLINHNPRNSFVSSLSKALAVNTTLSILNLKDTSIGDSGAGSLSNALAVNTTLTHLNVANNMISPFGASSLFNALTVNMGLTYLDLNWNLTGHGIGASLLKAFTVNATLTELNLRGNVISDFGTGFLSEALTANTSLTRLNLSKNEIGDSGACSLSKALTENTTLRHFNLSENTIGDPGACSLSKALTENTTLSHFNLSENKIGDSGACSLSKALTVNTTLSHLDLMLNWIGSSGFSSLSNAQTVNGTCSIMF